jgi:hypothetical protein
MCRPVEATVASTADGFLDCLLPRASLRQDRHISSKPTLALSEPVCKIERLAPAGRDGGSVGAFWSAVEIWLQRLHPTAYEHEAAVHKPVRSPAAASVVEHTWSAGRDAQKDVRAHQCTITREDAHLEGRVRRLCAPACCVGPTRHKGVRQANAPFVVGALQARLVVGQQPVLDP